MAMFPRRNRVRSQKHFGRYAEILEGRQLLAGQPQLINLNDQILEGSSWLSRSKTLAVQVGEQFYFQGETPDTGVELFRSQGTPDTTQLVDDFSPGTSSSHIQALTVLGNQVLSFRRARSGDNLAIHRIDPATNQLTLILNQPGQLADVEPIEFQGALFFLIVKQDGTSELWRTNGTSEGTQFLQSNPVGTIPSQLTVAGGRLYFTVALANGKFQLYQHAGLENPVFPLAKEFAQPPLAQAHLVRQYFFSQGEELWVTNGTEEGTFSLFTAASGSKLTPAANQATVFNGRVHFIAKESSGDKAMQLWSTDGTPAGTRKEAELGLSAGTDPAGIALRALGNRFYFFQTLAEGSRLWSMLANGTKLREEHYTQRTSGLALVPVTVDGQARLVVNTTVFIDSFTLATLVVQPNETLEVRRYSLSASRLNSLLYSGFKITVTSSGAIFTVITRRNPPLGINASYSQYVKLNLTSDTAIPVSSPFGSKDRGSNPDQFMHLGEQVYFAAEGTNAGKELWVSDGTAGGTRLIVDLYRGELGSGPTQLTAFNRQVLFAATHPDRGNELFITNVDATGVTRLTDGVPGVVSGYPEELTLLGNRAYFRLITPNAGYELWITDGTPAGTQLVTDIQAGPRSSRPGRFTPSGNQMFFVANDVTRGQDLWVSRGTAATTQRVLDIGESPTGNAVQQMIPYEGGLLFSTSMPGGATTWYFTDGTAAGTSLFDFEPFGNISPAEIYVVQEQFYFRVVGENGAWNLLSASIGSGTPKLLQAGRRDEPFVSLPAPDAQERFFFAKGTADGALLYASDGTADGTRVLMRAGSISGMRFVQDAKQRLPQRPDDLIFTVIDSLGAFSLWITNGTPEGTQPLRTRANINDFALVGDRAFSKSARLYDAGGTKNHELLISPVEVAFPPTEIIVSTTNIPLDLKAGETVAKITGVDPTPNDRLQFFEGPQPLGGDAAFFIVTPENQLVLIGDINKRLQPTYKIPIIAQDQEGNQLRQTFEFKLAPSRVQGDLNGDRLVDLNDFVILRSHFGKQGVSAMEGDTDGDGDVDLVDFVNLRRNFRSGPSTDG